MPEELRSDAEVVAAVLAGDVEAFGVLVDRHERRVFSLVYRMTSDRGDAEDLAQEVFYKLFQSLDRYDPALPLRNWLARIASNHTLNWLARKRPQTVPLESDGDLSSGRERFAVDPSPSPADLAQSREAEALVEAALARLPDNQRLVFVLKFMEDYTAEEIAEIVGAPRNTVKTWIFRARESLRLELSSAFEPAAKGRPS